jgi:hypothetical protein
MKPLILPVLSSGPSSDTTLHEVLDSIKLKQIAAFTTFNARRNSNRIERYFIHSRSATCRTVIILIGTLSFATLSIISVYFCLASLHDFALATVLSSARRLQDRIIESIILHFSDAYLYSEILVALLSPPDPVLDQRLPYAPLFTRVFHDAADSSTGSVYWWAFGRSDGMYIGMAFEPSTSDPRLLFFCNRSTRIFKTWIPDSTGYNASYPRENGTIAGSYNVTTVFWGSDAVNSGWSALYPAVDLPGEEKRSPMVVYRANSNDDTFMVTLGIHLKTIQELLEGLSDENTWLAIVGEHDTVLGATGAAHPYDSNNNLIILKTTDQTNDPVWRAFGQFAQTEEFKNIGEAPNTSWPLYGNVHPLNIPGASRWSLWMATSHAQVMGGEQVLILTMLFVCEVVVLVLLRIAYFASKRLIHRQRTKALAAPEKSGHVRRAGIDQAVSLAGQLVTAFPTHQELHSVLDDLVASISQSDGDLLYNVSAMTELVPEGELRNTFQASLCPADIYGQLSETVVDHKMITRPIPVFTEVMHGRIMEIIIQINRASPVFLPVQFERVVADLVGGVNREQLILLLFDSLEWDSLFLSTAGLTAMETVDGVLAVMLVTVCWHRVMLEHRDSMRLAERFVLMDSDALRQEMFNAKRNLYQCFNGGEGRWERFVRIVNDLVEHAPISRASEYLAISRVTAERRALTGSVFVTGLLSFMFRSDGLAVVKAAIAPLFPQAELSAWSKCVTRTIIKPAWIALAHFTRHPAHSAPEVQT